MSVTVSKLQASSKMKFTYTTYIQETDDIDMILYNTPGPGCSKHC